MSLVGPRPALPSEVEHYDGLALRRLTVPQGITCLAGRGSEVSFEEWMTLDNRYVDSWTPLGDLRSHRADGARSLAEGWHALSTFASFPSPALSPSPRFSLGASTLFIMGATLASTLLGFMREVVSAKYYSTRWEMDTFLAAATIPTILFGVFNGALVGRARPDLLEYLAHHKEDEAWRLASTGAARHRLDCVRGARLLYGAGTFP